ncbi:MAG: response regulator transcription factor [Kiritimatiellae bacterium]|nr:response regulator transcription factor [Kiritimatiellia bacterium]
MTSEKASAGQSHTRKKILLVDDHAILRRGLGLLINREGDLTVCAEAGDRAAALRETARTAPDLVVVDLSLEDESGLELIKDLAAQFPRTRVLVLSMLEESVYAPRAFKAGASGYVMKEESPEKLITAIRKLLTGGTYMSPALAEDWARRSLRTGEGSKPTLVDALTDRELEVFELMGRGFGPGEMSETLHLSVKTIETYRAHIKEKLGFTSAREMTHAAVEWMRQVNR